MTDPSDLPRQRRSHVKSRLGCKTCKLRHLKCDETQPECETCKNSGYVCGGYQRILLPRRNLKRKRAAMFEFKVVLSDKDSPPARISRNLTSNESVADLRAVAFFHDKALRGLDYFANETFWDHAVKRFVATVPFIRHIAIAISLNYEQSTQQGLTQTSGAQPERLFEPPVLALQHYTQATRLLRESLASRQPPVGLIKLACVLFIFFEIIIGHREAVTAHLASGARMLHLLPGKDEDRAEFTEVDSLIVRLRIIQGLHGQFRRPLLLPGADVAPVREEAIIGPFFNMREASMSLCIRISINHHFVALNSMAMRHLMPNDFCIETTQAALEAKMDTWSEALENFAAHLGQDNFNQRSCDILRAHRDTSMIFVRTCTTQRETTFDQHLQTFEAILERVERFVEDGDVWKRLSRLFSLNIALMSPLFYTALKCRNCSTRRKAISLLRRVPRREGVWDSIEAAKVAELVMNLEERHLPRIDNLDNTHFIPESARVRAVEIHEKPPDSSRQLIILHTMPAAHTPQTLEHRMYIDW